MISAFQSVQNEVVHQAAAGPYPRGAGPGAIQSAAPSRLAPAPGPPQAPHKQIANYLSAATSARQSGSTTINLPRLAQAGLHLDQPGAAHMKLGPRSTPSLVGERERDRERHCVELPRAESPAPARAKFGAASPAFRFAVEYDTLVSSQSNTLM